MNEVKLPFNARLTYTLLSLILIVFIAHIGQSIIVPLIFAFLLAVMLLPLSNFLERKGFPRWLAALVSLFVFIFVLMAIISLLGSQMASFISDFPALQKQVMQTASSAQQWVWRHFHIDVVRQTNYLEKAALGTLGSATTFISETFLSISALLIFCVFVMLYSFFLLLYRSLLLTFLVKLIQEQHRDKLLDIVAQTRYIIKSYVSGLMLEMLIVAVLNCVLFTILGIKYGLLLGIMAAIFNLVPYLGIFTAIIISMLITMTTGPMLGAIQVGLALFLVHLVDSNILLPRIVGSKVKINALVTIIGVVLGNMLWGISGMFLAIPIIAIMKIIFEHIDYLSAWALLLGDMPHPRKTDVKTVPADKSNVKEDNTTL
ncbi:Predicted PurR-regulated permease PerM [Chitinophaga costaii]|uniref:Predicted PurR-regulated permease PerM n=1 Tax=Chitinophaga costaii TaxID=1335309 RepID=A0A1C4CSR6_9BACT|nr:AI-2E family transporter [Chitinophaga costaii]SCC22205.1 Predicted PurR-regulated permease PerM [Chitinophaga costaii]